jgi:hypothetical protein
MIVLPPILKLTQGLLKPEKLLKPRKLLKLVVLQFKPDEWLLKPGEKALERGERGEYGLLIVRDDVGAACCWLRGGVLDVDPFLVGDVARGEAESRGGGVEYAEEATESRSAILSLKRLILRLSS